MLDLPPTSAESLLRGDPRILGWVKEAVQEGDRIVQSDPSYEQIERSLRYVVGDQLNPEYARLKYLPQVTINESRKAMQAHVSALTDLKPLFGWKTLNPAYQQQSDLLNQYAVAEWVTTLADLDLGDCIKLALVAGTGDLGVDWDPHAPLGGAHSLSARDPRDTLPIRPSHARSLQLWEGVCLREEHTVNALRGMYPTRAAYFRASADSTLGKVMGKFKTMASRILTPADPLDSLGQNVTHTRKSHAGSLVLYRTYFHDRTRNLTAKPIVMGEPSASWAYLVGPNQPLYPRGRLVVTTDDLVLYDGPNTYQHGLFPVCRLRLWSVPWQFLGIPIFNDLLPLQDAINDTVNDLRLGIRQWMDPDIVYNRNAVSESTMRTLDPRRPGKRIKTNPSFGEPYDKKEGPNAQVLALASELWDKLTTKHNDLSGTANLAALLQLRQLPSADTIQKYYEALTPEIRQEARQVEAFMRDLSEMTKDNYFQFLSTARRVAILGDAGVTLQDFDFDPQKMVPALRPDQPGYTPELDAALTTASERQQFFSKQFVFIVSPNSILAMNGTERKMQTLQMMQMGLIDFWTFHEVFETPNVGAPPAIPLPPLQALDEQTQLAIVQQMLLQQQQQQQMAAQMGGGAAGGGMGGGMPMGGPGPVEVNGKTYLVDPMSMQILEIRVPTTIVERLQAQGMLGIGASVSAQGRKATNEAPAHAETKGDRPGGRQTTSTSDK